PGLWVPVLDQAYMTNHLALAGALLARVLDPVLAPRIWHALLGLVSLLLLDDVGRAFLSSRARLLACALAATSATFTFMFSWARFDESLSSVASLAVLAFGLRYRKDGRVLWLALACLSAGLGVSAKLTTLWPLGGMALGALIARARPSPRARRHLLVAAPLGL